MSNRYLLVLLAILGLLGLAYSLVTPLFEAPDEVWHYAYVRYLVDQHTLPPLDDPYTGAYQEVAQPPLYYLFAALASGWVSDTDLPELMWHNPGFGYQAGGTVNDNKNMLIHTARERFPWQGAVLAVRLARLVALAFGLLAVVGTWGLGREAFPDRPALALSTAALVAFLPQFLFISGVASNDSAAAALASASLWATARTLNRGPSPRRALLLGLLLGLAALTKTSCLLLTPLALLALVVAPETTFLARKKQPSFRLFSWLLTAATATLVGGWWYLRNALLYHDPLALHAHLDTPWGRSAAPSLLTLLSELPQVHRSFWGAFGWGHVEYPPWVYLVLGGLLLFGLLGWLVSLRTRRLPGSRTTLLLAAAWSTMVLAALLQWMRQVGAPHGRLLFPAIAAWAVLMVAGWTNCRLPIADSTFNIRILNLEFTVGNLPFVLPVCLLLLSLLTPWLVIRPAFAAPQLLTPARAVETVEAVDLTYGGVAQLLGVALDRSTATPGGPLVVRACWTAAAPIERDYTVFVQLIGRGNARVGDRYTYPGLGRFPTSLWPVGQAFCDDYRLDVEEWAPTPELYDVVVGLFDAATDERLAVRDSAGAEIGLPVVAQLRITSQQPLAVTPQHPLDYRLGDEIALLGYDLSAPPGSSTPLTVTLYWRAIAQPSADYTVLLHLLDENGQPLAQRDGPPRADRYPTSVWQPGDIVPDMHVLDVPSLSSGQQARLVTGMYLPATLERLPVVGPQGIEADGLIPLTQ